MIGLIVGALLPVLAPEPVNYGYTRADLIAGWAGIPLNSWIYRFTDWGWDEADRRGFMLLALTLNGGFWGAAGVAVVRALRSSPVFRRTAIRASLLELPLAIGVWVALLPGPLGGTPVQNAFELAHLPGLLLLQEIGLCCGYFNSTVIRDWGGPYRPSAFGMSLLVSSNIIMFVALAYAGCAIFGRVRSRQGRRRVAAPVAEG